MACVRLEETLATFPECRVMSRERERAFNATPALQFSDVCAVTLFVNSALPRSCSSYEWERNESQDGSVGLRAFNRWAQ